MMWLPRPERKCPAKLFGRCPLKKITRCRLTEASKRAAAKWIARGGGVRVIASLMEWGK